MFKPIAIIALFFTAMAWTPPLWAHAIIVTASPAPQEVVTGPDINVALTFNSRLDLKRSRLTLIGADGSMRPIDIMADDEPQIIKAKIDKLVSGDYRLRWQVLAIDGHITRGDILFSVK